MRMWCRCSLSLPPLKKILIKKSIWPAELEGSRVQLRVWREKVAVFKLACNILIYYNCVVLDCLQKQVTRMNRQKKSNSFVHSCTVWECFILSFATGAQLCIGKEETRKEKERKERKVAPDWKCLRPSHSPRKVLSKLCKRPKTQLSNKVEPAGVDKLCVVLFIKT